MQVWSPACLARDGGGNAGGDGSGHARGTHNRAHLDRHLFDGGRFRVSLALSFAPGGVPWWVEWRRAGFVQQEGEPTMRALTLWEPSRGAFGNCTWPAEAAGCPSERTHGNALNSLIGMYASWHACDAHAVPRPVRHHHLAEVTRLVHPLSKWKEGLSAGWLPNRSGHAHRVPCTQLKARTPPLVWVYSDLTSPAVPSVRGGLADGCWFYLAPGSGVFINVSRTRIAQTRDELRAEWHMPPSRGNNNNDGHFCGAAMAHKLHSLQFLGRSKNQSGAAFGNRSRGLAVPELAFCAGSCVHEESRTPCPAGVPLWRADGSPCTCDPHWPLLRCLEDVRSGRARHTRVDPCPARASGVGGSLSGSMPAGTAKDGTAKDGTAKGGTAKDGTAKA